MCDIRVGIMKRIVTNNWSVTWFFCVIQWKGNESRDIESRFRS